MKLVLRAAALVAICLAMITVRVVWSSHAALRAAGSSTGDDRIRDLGRAARLYTPGNPYARRALDALAAEARTGSLTAWREIRSAILATRSVYTPHAGLLDEANREIARLTAAAEPDSRGSLAERTAWHAARLAHDDAPSIPWTLVALLGLAAWIAGAVLFFTRAVDEQDRLRKRPALVTALTVAAGLVLFFLGLARA